ncbi:MAG: biotin/lipoyl-containing protein [Vulcanimicrobiota bacterium]
MKRFRYSHDEVEQEVVLEATKEGYRATLEGRTLDFSMLDGVAVLKGRNLPYRVYHDGRQVWVWLAGRVHTFEPVTTTARRSQGALGAGGGDLVKASMPGKILEVRVTPGQEVEAGQVVVVMESMKMELTIASPRAGTVARVNCEAGVMVALGDELVRLEAEDD